MVDIYTAVNRTGEAYDSVGKVIQTNRDSLQTKSTIMRQHHFFRYNAVLLTNILYNASLAKKTNMSSNAVVANRFIFWKTRY